jgi:hypothetical protein
MDGRRGSVQPGDQDVGGLRPRDKGDGGQLAVLGVRLSPVTVITPCRVASITPDPAAPPAMICPHTLVGGAPLLERLSRPHAATEQAATSSATGTAVCRTNPPVAMTGR